MLTQAANTITIPPALALVNLLLTCLAVGCASVYVLLLKGKPANRLTIAIDKLGLNTIHPVIAVVASVVWLLLFASLIAGIFYVLEGVIERSFPTNQPETSDLRGSLLALTAFTATLGAVVTLPLSLIRTRQNARQTDVAEQGLVTDRINKAVEGLGSVRPAKAKDNESEPNIEVRIGALFALERISQENDDFHVQIMEILCAYIVNNADRDSPALPKEDPPEGWREWGSNNRTHPPLDVDTALKIIERRSDDRKKIEKAYNDGEGYRLGLERAPLQALALGNRDLSGADLSQAQLQGAELMAAKLQGAVLSAAKLQGAELMKANLQGADLEEAGLQRAYLGFARFRGAYLGQAGLQGADLWYAELQGAVLSGAKLQGAVLWGTEFDKFTDTWGANFSGSACASVNFTDSQLTQDKLETMFGDATTILPDGKGPDSPDWPDHWPTEELDWGDFEKRWRAWQAEQGFQPDENPQ